MKTSLKRTAPLRRGTMGLLCVLIAGVISVVSPGCGPGKTTGDAGDAGVEEDGGKPDSGRDGGRDGGMDASVDDGGTDGGPVDCFANPRTPDEIARGCTNSFRIPVTRTPPCATGSTLPAPRSDLPAECLPKDAGEVMLPDGSTCYFPDAGAPG